VWEMTTLDPKLLTWYHNSERQEAELVCPVDGRWITKFRVCHTGDNAIQT